MMLRNNGFCSIVAMMAALMMLAPGCKRAPEAASMRSLQKLEGAPTRVFAVKFAPDSASVLVDETRPPKDITSDEQPIYAISRRPIAGGAPKDLIASTDRILDFASLGNDIVVRKHRLPPPPKTADLPASAEERRKVFDQHDAEVRAAAKDTGLYRITDGGAPVRVSPPSTNCTYVVGAKGGQWVAYMLEGPEGDREIHVLGTQPGQEAKLSLKWLMLRDISPDGKRLIVESEPKTTEEILSDAPRTNAIVTVDGGIFSDVPESLKVDGKAVSTKGVPVMFTDDGLLFRSDEGEMYRSALDGSKAVRLVGPLEDPSTLTDAGASAATVGSAVPSAAHTTQPPRGTKRILGPKGTVFEMRDDAAGRVSITSVSDNGAKVRATLEGPLKAFSSITIDAKEERFAFAVLSDTSRDGQFNVTRDDAEVFVNNTADGSLSFGRMPVTLLADELASKIAAAASIPAASVHISDAKGKFDVIAELPLVEGEKGKELAHRVMTAAKAIKPITDAVVERFKTVKLRVGPLELKLVEDDDGGQSHIVLTSPGLWIEDSEGASLVLHDPLHVTSFSADTISGALENTGKEPTPPIDVVVVVPGRTSAEEKREYSQRISFIAPGKRATYQISVPDAWKGTMSSVPEFRSAGKLLRVFNVRPRDHSIDWLDTALGMRAAHGVWGEHTLIRRKGNSWYSLRSENRVNLLLVHITAEQAALPEAESLKFFRTIEDGFARHSEKLHEVRPEVTFEAPSGIRYTSGNPVGYKPTVSIGELSGSKGNTADAAAVLATMNSDFVRCYTRELDEDASMKGSVKIRMHINDGGGVFSAYETAPYMLFHDGLVSCITDRLENAQFAPPKGGHAMIEIPMTFAIE